MPDYQAELDSVLNAPEEAPAKDYAKELAEVMASDERPGAPKIEKPEGSWVDTAQDAGIGLAEGLSRGVGVNPTKAAGFLGEKGAQVAKFFGSDVNPEEFGHKAEAGVRDVLDTAHRESPTASGIGKFLGEVAPGVAMTAATGGVVNPLVTGAVAGGLSGLGNSEADTLSGAAGDAAAGAAFGGATGALGRGVAAGGKWFDSLLKKAADNPTAMRLAGEGVARSAVGSAVGPWASVLMSETPGKFLAEKVMPGVTRGIGKAVAGASGAESPGLREGVTQAVSRSGGSSGWYKHLLGRDGVTPAEAGKAHAEAKVENDKAKADLARIMNDE